MREVFFFLMNNKCDKLVGCWNNAFILFPDFMLMFTSGCKSLYGKSEAKNSLLLTIAY